MPSTKKTDKHTGSTLNSFLKKEKITPEPSVRKLWAAALRSGKYKQGFGQLRYKNKYCCLGVLTDLAVKAGVLDKKIGLATLTHGFLPPDEVVAWAGLRNDCGAYSDRNKLREGLQSPRLSLTCDNDNLKLSFNEIADRIEKEDSLWKKVTKVKKAKKK